MKVWGAGVVHGCRHDLGKTAWANWHYCHTLHATGNAAGLVYATHGWHPGDPAANWDFLNGTSFEEHLPADRGRAAGLPQGVPAELETPPCRCQG